MNVFEFAMQMEKDGEAFYREIAAKTKNPGLKKIFETLADEEVVHYNTFKQFLEKSQPETFESDVLNKAKSIFEEMKIAGFTDIADDEIPQTDAYRKAMDAEKEAYTFYEKKAEESDNEKERNILLTFAREERRHYRLLENVLEFVSRPDSWLADSEFVNMEEY